MTVSFEIRLGILERKCTNYRPSERLTLTNKIRTLSDVFIKIKDQFKDNNTELRLSKLINKFMPPVEVMSAEPLDELPYEIADSKQQETPEDSVEMNKEKEKNRSELIWL